MSLWRSLQDAAAGEAARWFQCEPPGALFASGELPPSIRAARALAEANRLPALLPYEAYDPTNDIFHNVDSVGFVLEAEPAAGLCEAQIQALSGLFTQGLRPGTSVQLTLYASPDVLPLLER